MSTAIHQHLSVETEVSITVQRPQNGGTGYMVSLDAPGSALLTVFMTREQLLALHAASSIALSRPEHVHASKEVSNGH